MAGIHEASEEISTEIISYENAVINASPFAVPDIQIKHETKYVPVTINIQAPERYG